MTPQTSVHVARFFNLSVLSKLLEHLVVRQLMEYLTSADLLPPLQSAFRPGHSTETAVLRVLTAVDRGDVVALTLLDLSATFDTVDHDIPVQRLHTTFGFDDVVFRWFRSYLSCRYQYVRRVSARSSTAYLTSGVLHSRVPQGSFMGSVLFIWYAVDLIALIESHGLSSHLYADDTQIIIYSAAVDLPLSMYFRRS